MPIYYHLRDSKPVATRKRTIDNLLALRQGLEQEIPEKTQDKNLLIATWNIREFDSKAYGKRADEALYYIAEIVSKFDIVAIQEVRDDLEGLKRLKYFLGSWWEYIFTDKNEGTPGNHERLAYVYDTRKVQFSGLAGEVVIPPMKGRNKKYEPSRQLVRTPFVVGFQSSWFKFALCTVHILYGENKKDTPARVKEIALLSDFLKSRMNDKYVLHPNLFLLGDFNIFKPKNQTFKEIERNFEVPEELKKLPSNAIKNKHYDQIAFELDTPKPILNAGVFDFYQYVYKVEDINEYIKEMGKAYNVTSQGKKRTQSSKKTYYKTYWRTHQMSDHLPMWIEIPIDDTETYLHSLR